MHWRDIITRWAIRRSQRKQPAPGTDESKMIVVSDPSCIVYDDQSMQNLVALGDL